MNRPLSDFCIARMRAWCFGGTDAPAPSEEECFELLCEHGLAAWGWFFMRDRLSAARRREAETVYRAHSALDFRQEAEFDRLQSVFAEQRIRFCPLKGADLAWRVYPAGALRPKGDLDILFRPEDCDKVLARLRQDGWNMPYQYRHEHHYPALIRHGVALEVHFQPPNFAACDVDAIWSELRPETATRFQLPLELNLLMLFQHARSHHWLNGLKLLADCGFLMGREGIPDWRKLDDLAQKFHLASPELLFGAFPDFFPKEAMPPKRFPAEDGQLFRSLLLENGKVEISAPVYVMSDRRRFNFTWWLERLNGMRSGSIRLQTGNPCGHYGKLGAGYLTVGWRKLRAFWRYRHGAADAATQRHLADLERIEKILSPLDKKKWHG